MAILASVYPFLWGTFILFLGMAVSVAVYLVRFVSFDPRSAIDSLNDSNPSTGT